MFGPAFAAAALRATVAERPRPSPRRRVRAGQRRCLARWGAHAGAVPVGGDLVGQRGDGASMRTANLRESSPSAGQQRLAEREPGRRPGRAALPLRRMRPVPSRCIGTTAPCSEARGTRRRRGTAGPSHRVNVRPPGRSPGSNRRRSGRRQSSAERRDDPGALDRDRVEHQRRRAAVTRVLKK